MKKIDLTGKKFGRLTVINRIENYVTPKGQKHSRYICRCDCGAEIKARGHDLLTGNTKSCGCLKKELVKTKSVTHGMEGSRLYNIWLGIKGRCLCASNGSYKNYCGRGITVCEEWRNDFQAFYDWAIASGYDESAPRGECTIDRIDVNGNYEPSNCRWVDSKIQANNRRNNSI